MVRKTSIQYLYMCGGPTACCRWVWLKYLYLAEMVAGSAFFGNNVLLLRADFQYGLLVCLDNTSGGTLTPDFDSPTTRSAGGVGGGLGVVDSTLVLLLAGDNDDACPYKDLRVVCRTSTTGGVAIWWWAKNGCLTT